MRLVHRRQSEQPKPKKKSRLPMDKDPVFLANLRREIVADHNKMIEKEKSRLVDQSGFWTNVNQIEP
jgi:hypothetical protein